MFSGRRLLFLLLFFSVVAGLVPQAYSQASDEVHIAPVPRPEKNAERADHSFEPDVHSKPVRVDVDTVLVPVTVVDVANHPVLSLEKQNFELYEAGEQQTLGYFGTEDSPISVGVLLDLSSSMTDKIDTARRALHEFFANCNPDDDYFVIGFSDRPVLISDSTRSTGTIENNVALTEPYGHTALLDSIYMGLNKLRQARYQRRALVIISDGGDNHSRYTAREIRSLVQEANVEIYALGVFSKVFKTYEEWAGENLLTTITQATGGQTIKVTDIEALPQEAAAISTLMRSQYVLGYHPTSRHYDNQWHKIKVRVLPPQEGTVLHVYSKQGYLARRH
ncbi:MAG TPA: VWA domain-containing protein [Candidatus Angelobacter sp.]|jgi:Ca-activated chloride channel homolog|nr:VWA domain-containing protein [Candidatus Angelobacter sp.]